MIAFVRVISRVVRISNTFKMISGMTSPLSAVVAVIISAHNFQSRGVSFRGIILKVSREIPRSISKYTILRKKTKEEYIRRGVYKRTVIL